MMQKDDTAYLRHILDAISKIEEYVAGVDYESFTENTLVQDAVMRQLEIIGEAARRVSYALKDRYIHIPWKSMAGMRDKLIHGYFGVDIDAVWDTLVQDIPALKAEVAEIVRGIGS